MRSYTHIAGAVLLFVTLAFFTNLDHVIIGIFFAGWGSVFPDIFDRLSGKHRGMGHSIFWLIPFVLMCFWNLTLGVAMLLGFISHVFLDILTTYGCPVLYPLWKTDFVCFGKKRRIKTGTNQDKAVFVFLLFLLIPVLLFTTSAGSIWKYSEDQNAVFATNSDAVDGSLNNNVMKNNFYLNFEFKEGVNKNISVQRVSENETNILVNDI